MTARNPFSGAAAEERTAAVNESLKPRDKFQSWLAEEIARFSLTVDHCRAHESIELAIQADRADSPSGWDDDLDLDAEVLAERLSRRPAVVARQLKRTRHG